MAEPVNPTPSAAYLHDGEPVVSQGESARPPQVPTATDTGVAEAVGQPHAARVDPLDALEAKWAKTTDPPEDQPAEKTRWRLLNGRALFYTALIAGYAAMAEWGPTPFMRYVGLLAFASTLISAIKS